MLRHLRVTALVVAVAAAVISAGAQGATQSHASHRDVEGGSATLVTSALQSLDPAVGNYTANSEISYQVYLGLLTLSHTKCCSPPSVIPALARALPKVSKDGMVYTLFLRKGLKYSNGTPVKASDFGFSVARALKLNWGGSSYFTGDIQGAADYQAGRASSVSGISTNDKTGQITIRLVHADGSFPTILTYPGSALLPSSTPIQDEGSSPPPGVGPYKITSVVPNQSAELTRVKSFAQFHIPGIPTGHLNTIEIKINPNTLTGGQQVLNNQADVFDPSDVIPPALLDPIKSQAANRFRAEPAAGLYYLFMNTKIAPFNNKLARQAVAYAFDRNAAVRLFTGFVTPACYFLPIGVVGHPTKPCPLTGKALAPPNLTKARALIQQANLTHTSVTVWSLSTSPYQELGAYYTSVLNSIGLDASLKTLSASVYYGTTANPSLNVQTGFASFYANTPYGFYTLLDARSITPSFSRNRSYVNDPQVQNGITSLIPLSLQSAAANTGWQSLDYYVAQQVYYYVIGYPKAPLFLSNRLDITKAIYNPAFLNDLSSWQLKK